MRLMMGIMELSRAHAESAMKSERIGAAWRRKKQAAKGGTPMTPIVPAWLKLDGDRIVILDEAAELVRRIYRMSVGGLGALAIAKRLNREAVPAIGRAGHWSKSSVMDILSNPATYGIYLPRKGAGRDRVPDGDPVPNYYPAVISQREFFAARAAAASRKGKPGRPAKSGVNLFTGLLRDARTGDTLTLCERGPTWRYYLPSASVRGTPTASRVGFPAKPFEDAILSLLREIDPRSILPEAADDTLAVAGRLAAIEGQIAKLQDKLESAFSEAAVEVLSRLEKRRVVLLGELAEARRTAASPLAEEWAGVGSLVEALRAAPDPGEARTRLRGVLRRVVEGVWCVFVAAGKTRFAAVQVWFSGGSHRDYLIVHKPATGGSVGVRPSQWWARSLAEVAPAELDFRLRKDAGKILRVLEALDFAEAKVG
jgi:hypothetical protein